MPIYTFSTRSKRPLDTEAVESVKQYCDEQGLNFSALIVNLLKRHADELKAPGT